MHCVAWWVVCNIALYQCGEGCMSHIQQHFTLLSHNTFAQFIKVEPFWMPDQLGRDDLA